MQKLPLFSLLLGLAVTTGASANTTEQQLIGKWSCSYIAKTELTYGTGSDTLTFSPDGTGYGISTYFEWFNGVALEWFEFKYHFKWMVVGDKLHYTQVISDGLEESKAEMIGETVPNDELANDMVQSMMDEPDKIKFHNADVYENVVDDPQMIYKDLCVRYYEPAEGEIP